MQTLDQTSDESSPVHLLLIGDTKVGKSTYAAQAALDGFELLYVDMDNGLTALQHAFRVAGKAGEEAAKRVHYVNPHNGIPFMHCLLSSTENRPGLWLPDEHKIYRAKKMASLTKEVDSRTLWVMDFTKFPANGILVEDSWSSLAAEALGLREKNSVSALLDGTSDQSLYGEARARLDYTINLLQQAHCHVIVQAHPTKYEIYGKATGMSGAEAGKQKNMTLLEVIDSPISSSRGHGKEMGSRFNHIGWLGLSNLGAVEIDFTRKINRVGGGPPNRKDKVDKLSMLSIVSESGAAMPTKMSAPESVDWFYTTTVADYEANQKL